MMRTFPQKSLIRFASGGVLALVTSGFGVSLLPLQAQSIETESLPVASFTVGTAEAKAATSKANKPWKAPKKGLPGSREDGGTRADAGGMSVFSPAGGVVALATAEPNLLVRMDDSMASRTVNLLVMDEAGDVLYDKDFRVAGQTGGTFRLDVAEEDLKQGLMPNQDYHWNLMVLPEDPQALDFGSTENPVISGKFRRLAPGDGEDGITPEIAQQLAEASPLQKARILYEELGHWHECASILSKIMQDPNTSPEDLLKANQAWTQSMSFGGHGDIASEMPIASPMVEVTESAQL